MKLMDLFRKLTPAEFAQIQGLLLLEKDISEDLEPFIEKLCSDEVLEAWRQKRWTLEDILLFYHQKLLNLDSEELLQTSSPISAKKRTVIEEPSTFLKSGSSDETTCVPPILPSNSSEERGSASDPLTFLESDSSEEILALAMDSALNPSSTEDLQRPIELSIVKKVSFAAEAESVQSKPTSCFKAEQLQQLERKTRRALKNPFVVKAMEDRMIRPEDFSSILKINKHSWAISYIFSEKGLEDLRCGKITLAQLAIIPCQEYLDGLLTPHAQKALQSRYISIEFIARIWFRLRHKKIDMELVAIVLSEKFLTLIEEAKFNLIELYYKIYSDIYDDLDFERCLDGGYSDKTDRILRTFLSVWVEGLTIFCSANAQEFFSENAAQQHFFARLWCFHRKKIPPVQIVFEKLSGLQLAFSDEGYWAIRHGYLTFSDCDRYENNVVKTYIRQLRNNPALRDVIKQAQLVPEVILGCYAIRFQLGYDSSSDELSIEQYPGEYFDLFTTPIALQAFKENKICLDTTKGRKAAIQLLNKRKEYVEKLEAYIDTKRTVIKAYNVSPYLFNVAKEEEKKASLAAGKVCNQLQGMNNKPFTKEEAKSLSTAEMVAIFGSADELISILRTATRPRILSPLNVQRSKYAHPLDRVYCKPNVSCSAHALGSASALFQSQRNLPVEDEPKKPSNDTENTDATFDVFSVALGGGRVP